jgi:hypothetical protein
MADLVYLYMQKEKQKQDMKKLRAMAKELREVQNAARPMIEEINRKERERRSTGDGFIIVT